MKTKNQQLDDLFTTWQKRLNENIVKDGIISEKEFDKAPKKVLFITKEPNNPKKDAGDFRKWWKDKIKYTFSIRIAEWSHGIMEGFPPYDDIKRSDQLKLKALHKVAFMNIKKVGGTGNSEYASIFDHSKKYKDLILEEIKIIAPEIIILGVSWKSIRKELFGDGWKDSGYDIAIKKFNGAKLIDYYHPSSRTGTSATYSLLQNIINSTAFKTLK